jgi:hypothetical protein
MGLARNLADGTHGIGRVDMSNVFNSFGFTGGRNSASCRVFQVSDQRNLYPSVFYFLRIGWRIFASKVSAVVTIPIGVVHILD